jgi:hypothetical protein
MSQSVQLPDGTILQFPDDMSEQDMANAVRNYTASQGGAEAPTSVSPDTPAPKQRIRSILQGLTFGGADEAEAFLRSLGPKEYSEVLNEVRGQLKDYQQDSPGKAIAYEMGGATLPVIIASLFTGGSGGAATTASYFPKLAQIFGSAAPTSLRNAAAVSTVQGGLTGFGKGEGDFQNRAKTGGIGAATGLVAGTAISAAAPLVTNRIVDVVDFARRKLGGRGARIVETELQRLAEETGKSVDEIIEGVANGSIMAENRTLGDALKGYVREGGSAASRIKQTMTQRPTQTRNDAMDEIGAGLSNTANPNILAAQKADEITARSLEKEAYAPFKTGAAPDEVTAALQQAINAVPESASALNRVFRARTGTTPLFKIKEGGDVEFVRPPTVEEAELVRRTLSGMANKEFNPASATGVPTVGEAIDEVQTGLRAALDETVPDLAATRAAASNTRTARDAFQDGLSSLSKTGGADAVAVEFDEVMKKGADAVKSYRAGVMQAIRTRMGTGSRESMMRKLADPELKEGAILRVVFPEDQLPSVLNLINRAANSQAAKGKILGGSDTAIVQGQAARQGMNIGLGDVVDIASGSPMALARMLGKVAKNAAPNLNDGQRDQVVQVLLSENADLVRNALRDESALMQLQQMAAGLAQTLNRSAQRAGVVGAASAPSNSGLLNLTNAR